MPLSAGRYLFVSAFTAAVVIGAAWAYTNLFPMAFLEGGYPIWAAKQSILRECQFGDLLVLGDSRPESAIVPERLPITAANVTFGGTTPIETWFFAKTAMQCPKPPRIVIYSHSMEAFMRPNFLLWKNATRYGFLGFRDLREVAATAAALHDPSLAGVSTRDGLDGAFRDLVYSSGFPSIFMASLIEGRVFGRYAYNRALFARTAATKGQVTYTETAPGSHIGNDADIGAFAPSPLEAAYFAKTLAVFAAAHVTVLVLTVPVGNQTYAAINTRARIDFARFLESYSNRYPGVIAWTPDIAAWPDNLFVDGSHMDMQGAEIFTEDLSACLRRPGAVTKRCDLTWK
jgi:hypothetical protein